ncbi:DUF1289 domain-containing protein [Halopseudomonas sabulinigri]|uniref:DUF1289 domain-containing protein n=1 Tax=Halopseudomonas sabulinigri TaxID=472181 RepID=A0A1H1WRS5_9GAMM|nr:DUF1289 domain-containing protein [Halopseudomonas sabulinigri]SDS99927.1 hypothetical protein SAMN05216271_3316 [Halopseudomonas sabulinigri]
MGAQSPVRSPCVSICALDDNDICTGCQRSGMEIATWGRMSDAQRLEVLQRCEARARDQGLWLGTLNQQGYKA